MPDREKVIKALERCIGEECDDCKYEYDGAVTLAYCKEDLMRDVLTLLKMYEPVEANCEYQCNKCKFYKGVHNVMGHAPCSLWKIGGVMWNDYCSRFNLWKESEVE